jgi:hypothetical protein
VYLDFPLTLSYIDSQTPYLLRSYYRGELWVARLSLTDLLEMRLGSIGSMFPVLPPVTESGSKSVGVPGSCSQSPCSKGARSDTRVNARLRGPLVTFSIFQFTGGEIFWRLRRVPER